MTNRGAVALVDWLGAQAQFNGSLDWFSAHGISSATLERMLDGTVVPSGLVRAAIGHVTDGVVTGEMWDEPVADPTVIGVDGGGVDEAPVAVLPVAAFPLADRPPPGHSPASPVPSPALLCEISGPLGTMPSGPPFRTITDPMLPGLFVLAGPGVALVLDEPLGWALREALTMGLQDIHAESRPLVAAGGRTIG